MEAYAFRVRADGLPFDTEGEVQVPGASAPVFCSPADGHAGHVEPNVWMRRVC